MTKAGKKAKAVAGGKAATSSKAQGSSQVSAAQLFQQAQVALRFDDFDAAKQALRQAVKLEPSNGALMDAYACLLAELGDDAAEDVLKQAVQLAPNSGHEKYMYLAQMADEPSQAIQYSSQGLALLQQALDAATADPSQRHEPKALSKALCGALCSHAEMLLSQACAAREMAVMTAAGLPPGACPGPEGPDPRKTPLDPGLVSQIQAALHRAKVLQPHSPEPGQAMACLLSEQGQSEAALATLKESMATWWDEEEDEEEQEQIDQDGDQGASDMDTEQPGPASSSQPQQQHDHSMAAADGPRLPGEPEEEEEEEDNTPSFEFRFECAKLLLELDESTETAVGVLSALVEEYDSNPDVWHLLALALYSGHEYEEALEVAMKGLQLLRRLRVPKKDPAWGMFEELMTAIKEAAGEAAAAAGAAGIKPGH